MPDWDFRIVARSFSAIALVLGAFFIVIGQTGWGILFVAIAVGTFILTIVNRND